MKKIIVTSWCKSDRTILVDDADFKYLSSFNWRTHTGCSTSYAYTSIRIRGKSTPTQMANLLMKPEKHLIVDHINGNGLDNRRKNLEIVTHGENIRRGWVMRKIN